jgi:hypothetical protein
LTSEIDPQKGKDGHGNDETPLGFIGQLANGYEVKPKE